jgi:hypothetical protein
VVSQLIGAVDPLASDFEPFFGVLGMEYLGGLSARVGRSL